MGVLRTMWRTLTSCVTCSKSSLKNEINEHYNESSIESIEDVLNEREPSIDLNDPTIMELHTLHQLTIEKENATPEMELSYLDPSSDLLNPIPSLDIEQKELAQNSDLDSDNESPVMEILNELISDVIQKSKTSELYLSELIDDIIIDAIKRSKKKVVTFPKRVWFSDEDEFYFY